MTAQRPQYKLAGAGLTASSYPCHGVVLQTPWLPLTWFYGEGWESVGCWPKGWDGTLCLCKQQHNATRAEAALEEAEKNAAQP